MRLIAPLLWPAPPLSPQVPLQELFELLSLETVLGVFRGLLLEQKVLFLSNQPGRLCSIIEAFCSFLFPFQWFHVCPHRPPPRRNSQGVILANGDVVRRKGRSTHCRLLR